MTPQDQQFWSIFLILGVPLIILYGGPFGWRALVLLAALAGLVTYPLLTILILVAYALRWLAVDFLIALAAGWGARLSGVFNSAERSERQRERWEDRRHR